MTPAVVRARDLRTLLAHYRWVLGFELLQEVAGVLAIVRRGGLLLQLPQGRSHGPQVCPVPLDGEASPHHQPEAHDAHDASALVEDAPRLQAWGAWEFSLCDPQGNRLVFSQWALRDAQI